MAPEDHETDPAQAQMAFGSSDVALIDGVLVNGHGDPVSGFVPADTRPSVPNQVVGKEPFAEVIAVQVETVDTVDPRAAFSRKELEKHDRGIDGVLEAQQHGGELLAGGRRWHRIHLWPRFN